MSDEEAEEYFIGLDDQSAAFRTWLSIMIAGAGLLVLPAVAFVSRLLVKSHKK